MTHPAPPVSARALQASVADLQSVRPGPGLFQVALRASFLFVFLAIATRAWWTGAVVLYGVSGLAVGFAWASLLILTHDAGHHTLTGIGRLDETIARLIAWPVLWCHATYSQVHSLHHRMNGSDFGDPERVHRTQAEVAATTGFARFQLRHQMVWGMFVRGAAGLISETIQQGWKNRAGRPRMVPAIIEDLVGFVVGAGSLHTLAWFVAERIEPGRGAHMVLGTVLLWVFVERVTGQVMYFRKNVEHDGVWEEGANFFETQCFSTRNFRTNRFLAAYFSGLHRHSVHHAFPRIPFYAMEEAHERVAALYRAAGRELPMSDGYVQTFWDVWAASRKRGTAGSTAAAERAWERSGKCGPSMRRDP